MQIVLKTPDVAELMNCSQQWVCQLAKEGKLPGKKIANSDDWVFPLKDLDAPFQLKYYQARKTELPGLAEFTQSLMKQGKPFDH